MLSYLVNMEISKKIHTDIFLYVKSSIMLNVQEKNKCKETAVVVKMVAGSHLRQGLDGDEVFRPPVQHALIQLIVLKIFSLLPLFLLAFSILIVILEDFL